MDSFLTSVIRAYLVNEKRSDLEQYCFVFPNKRTCTFFHHEMAQVMMQSGEEGLQPASMAIQDFINDLSESVQADRLEALFLLYGTYREVVRSRYPGRGDETDFNRFMRWADVLMSDFNDVDMAMADPAQIFRNVEELREINADYLTPRQIEAIRRTWGDEHTPPEVDRFWSHIVKPLGSADKQHSSGMGFIRLWQVLEEVYTGFRKHLSERGLHYMGMAYRRVAEELQRMSARDLPYKRYIFVGFSVLTEAEKRIFKAMQQMAHPDGSIAADFYWDNASPAFRLKGNTGGDFVNTLAKQFPPLYDCVQPIDSFPKIEVMGVPSRVGMAKLAGEIFSEVYTGLQGKKEGEDIPAEMLRSAMVLPDEGLTAAALRSIPDYVSPINITMGFKLRDSGLASFVRLVVRMQMRIRRTAVSERNEYLTEDVLRVLSHPLMHDVYPRESSLAILILRYKRQFTTRADMFVSPRLQALEPVFRFVRNAGEPGPVLEYLTDLLDWTLDALTAKARSRGEAVATPETEELPDTEEPEVDADGTEIPADVKADAAAIDRIMARRYRAAIEHMRHLASRYMTQGKIYLAESTLFQLIERMVQGESVNFTGKPLKGMQIMGVLEARAIDFDNIIIPSLNENTFPRRHYTRSLIPPVIRAAYGLFTLEHNEALYSYYFYRMIARAKRVWLLYDARRQDAGQMSRYIHQLSRLYNPEGLTSRIVGYEVKLPASLAAGVKKTPRIMERLALYTQPAAEGEKPKALSASSINLYINCPLSFYLQYIEGYKREDDIKDWIDEGTYGTVVHDVFEKFYAGLKARTEASRGKFAPLTQSDILEAAAETVNIDRLITRAINEYFNNLGENVDTPLTGEAKVVGVVIRDYVVSSLRLDAAEAPFIYVRGEKDVNCQLRLAADGDEGEEQSVTFNFTAKIDRIDRVEISEENPHGTLRIIDYKTGADVTTIKDVEQMFTTDKSKGKRAKAMLQLFLYAEAYNQSRGKDDPIRLRINSIGNVFKEGFPELKIDGETGFDYHKFLPEVNRRLVPILQELFDDKTPFMPSADDSACKYCKFQDICGRNPK